MINFSESGHPVFLGSSALEREAFKKIKEKKKCQYIFCGDDETADVFCRTIISVNRLSIRGAVADICDELVWRLSGCSEGTRKPVAEKNSQTMVLPTELSRTNKTPRSNERVQGNLLRGYQRKFANQIIFQLIKLCSNASITKTVAKGQYFTTLDDAELDKLGY